MKIIKQTESELILSHKEYGSILFGLFALWFVYGMGQQIITLVSGATAGAVIFLVVGLYLIAQAQFSTIRLDKGKGIGSIKRRSLLKQSYREIPLNSIKSVALKRRENMNATNENASPRAFYFLVLSLVGAEDVALDASISKGTFMVNGILGRGNIQKIIVGKTIAAFLSVPFQDSE